MVYTDSLVFIVYVICHVLHMTHEGAWVCAAAAVLFLQHVNKLTPAYAVLFGKVISATQKTVALPSMYVYPVDAVYVAISMYTLSNTVWKKSRRFSKQLPHRRMMLCVFILLSYVAHGTHSNVLNQPLWQSCIRVALFIAACRVSRSTDWDTLGKTFWILNVPLPVLTLVPVQIKVELDAKRTEVRKQIVVTEKGPMLV